MKTHHTYYVCSTCDKVQREEQATGRSDLITVGSTRIDRDSILYGTACHGMPFVPDGCVHPGTPGTKTVRIEVRCNDTECIITDADVQPCTPMMEEGTE